MRSGDVEAGIKVLGVIAGDVVVVPADVSRTTVVTGSVEVGAVVMLPRPGRLTVAVTPIDGAGAAVVVAQVSGPT